MNELFGDFDVNSSDDEDNIEKASKKKLDIFADVLPNIGSNNYDYYKNLDDDEKKLYQPYTIMKWVSCTPGTIHEDFVRNINEFVNIDFWSLSKHPGLQHQLMCISNELSAGSKNTRHNWIPFLSTTKKKSTINDFFRTLDQNLNDQEVQLLKSTYSTSEFEALVKMHGVQDAELKKIMKAWKDETK